MTIETGALEQAYVDEEASYNPTSPGALGATDGIRHLVLDLSRKLGREASPEKRGTPDEYQSLARRAASRFDLSSIMWEPSGTNGTISNVGKLIEGGMGTKTTPALVTTVEASPSPTTTGCTLTSASGLAVGDQMVFTVGSGARREVTRIKTIATAAVTFDALSAAPDAPGAAVSGVNYKLASAIAKSYAIYKYLNAGGFEQAVYGAVVDRVQVTLDGTKEAMLAISGPAAAFADSTYGTVQSKPASHTTVGAPASGMTGNVYIDGSAFPIIAAVVTMQNQIELRNKELGTAVATGIAGRTQHRKITCSLTFYVEDTNLFTKAHAVTKPVVRILIGSANGSMLGVVMPSVEFEIPDLPNNLGPLEVTIEGVCYASSAGNDALFLGEH